MRGSIGALVVVGLVVGCGTSVQPTIGTAPPSSTLDGQSGCDGLCDGCRNPEFDPRVNGLACPDRHSKFERCADGHAGRNRDTRRDADGQPHRRPAAGRRPGGDRPPDFTTVIDNQYWPMTPGSVWTYRETDAEGTVATVVVTVTGDTKEILGVTTVVVHDVLTEDGTVGEDTFDWYAQDLDGNIWYFGEDTKEFTNRGVNTAGSWEAGVNGALPGVIVPAAPAARPDLPPGVPRRRGRGPGPRTEPRRVGRRGCRQLLRPAADEGVHAGRARRARVQVVRARRRRSHGLAVAGGSDREELTQYKPASP